MFGSFCTEPLHCVTLYGTNPLVYVLDVPAQRLNLWVKYNDALVDSTNILTMLQYCVGKNYLIISFDALNCRVGTEHLIEKNNTYQQVVGNLKTIKRLLNRYSHTVRLKT